MRNPKVTVIGEALIDLVPGDTPLAYRASPGGSPYNVAIGLARLGQDTALMARLADNAFGRILRDRAVAEGIDLAAAPHAAEPTTLAVVSLDAEGHASYDFYFDGTADWQWTAAETSRMPESTAVLHFGSIASWTAPGSASVIDLARRMRDRGDVLVSYDPNVRPGLLGGPRARPADGGARHPGRARGQGQRGGHRLALSRPGRGGRRAALAPAGGERSS